MNEAHQRFADEFLIDLNGKQAAIRAGYSEKRAEVTASELLKRDDVKEYLSVKRLLLSEQMEISQTRVLKEYARIAFSDIRKFYTDTNSLKNIVDLDDDAAAALAGIEVTEEFDYVDGEKVNAGWTKKIKTYDKTKALEALGKHLGIFEKDNSQQKQITNITVEL